MKVPENAPTGVSRRRFLAITAAATAAGALPAFANVTVMPTISWRGVALGAEATLTLLHPDAVAAHAAIDAALAEVARLEQIFSLYREDSALQRLNRNGRLDEAPVDLVTLLSQALRLAKETNGAFDPSLQPLWALYADHFSRRDAEPVGPSKEALRAALERVDWRNVELRAGCINFLKSGMAITLNGIAQGYITDKVGALLKSQGFDHVLVNMGEQLVLGPKWNGGAWSIGIADPADTSRRMTEVSITSGAVATSSSCGFRFDQAGRFTHILDPHTGAPAQQWASISVFAESAAVADGLSTALAVLPIAQAARLLGTSARAYVVPRDVHTGFWIG